MPAMFWITSIPFPIDKVLSCALKAEDIIKPMPKSLDSWNTTIIKKMKPH